VILFGGVLFTGLYRQELQGHNTGWILTCVVGYVPV